MAIINNIKLSTSSIKEAHTYSEISKNVAEEMWNKADAMYDSAKAHYDYWVQNLDAYIKKHTKTISKLSYYSTELINGGFHENNYFDQTKYDEDCEKAKNAATLWVTEHKSDYLTALNQFKLQVAKAQNNINKMFNCAEKLDKAVEDFEANEISDADYNTALENYNKGVENSSRYFTNGDGPKKATNVTAQDGKAVVLDENGVATTVEEGVNAAYSYTTTTADTAVAVAALGHHRNYSPEEIEEMQHKQVDFNYRKTQWAQSKGYFDTDGDTKKKAKEIYESTFHEPYTQENVSRRLEQMRRQSGLSQEEMEFLGAYMGSGTNAGSVTSFNSVVYNITKSNNPMFRPFAGETFGPSSSPVSHTPSPSSHIGGGYGDVLGGSAHATPASIVGKTNVLAGKAYNALEHAAAPMPTAANITSVASQSVPAPIPKDNAKFIDQQASEIFYGKNPEQVAADRANALSIVDKAFAGEGVEEFKDVLKQGGFDDVDIDIIMDNKEIAVTAYILASESQSLTNIANQLAAANNISNFDTMFDNGLSRMSLENGLSQSKLMAQVSEEVQDARTNLQNARNKYNSSVKKANDSIEEANKKKEKMEEIKRRITKKSGDDPSKWDDEDVAAYNKAIEEYNEANRTANEAHQEAMSNKELLDQAETNLQETEDRVANEYLEQQQSAHQAAQEQAQNTENVEMLDQAPEGTNVETVNNDPNVLSTDDIVGDANGNIEIQQTDQGEIADAQQTESKFISPDETIETVNEQATTGGTASVNTAQQNSGNTEIERKLTTDDIMDLFDNIDDVANVSSQERTLDAVDLSSLSPDDRTIPNLGVNSGMEEVNNVGPTDRAINPTDIGNIDGTDSRAINPADLGNIGGTDNRAINPADLGNINASDDRTIPNLEVNNSFDNISNISEISREMVPQSNAGGGTSGGNGLVGFADRAGQTASDKTKSFQDNKYSANGGFSINAGSMNGIGTDTSYASKSVTEEKKEVSGSTSMPEAPKTEKENIAGVQVESSDVERHSDGVLVDSDGHPASEVSEDGRSLEYVEVE